jgi:large subunit ribosomal protein L10
MLREKKISVVQELSRSFSDHSSLIVAHYHGLNVKQVTELRARLFDINVKLSVVKNKLARIALKGTTFAPLDSIFNGPTALVLSNDPVAVAKVLTKFANDNEALKIIKGVVYGSEVSAKEIEALSKMPSLNELRAKLIALLQAPATSLASVLTAPSGNIVRAVSAYSKK